MTTLNNNEVIVGRVQSDNWDEETIPIREAIQLLDLVKNLYFNIKNIEHSEIIIYLDNKYIIKEHYR